MSRKSERAQAEQLGMPVKTAATKLLRMWIFRLLQEVGKDICYRCGKRIETLATFSIDHKRAWLHGNTALYWDLENVAASHGKCNSGARRSFPRKHRDKKAQQRAGFARMYADPIKRDAWNARRRELYQQKRTITSHAV